MTRRYVACSFAIAGLVLAVAVGLAVHRCEDSPLTDAGRAAARSGAPVDGTDHVAAGGAGRAPIAHAPPDDDPATSLAGLRLRGRVLVGEVRAPASSGVLVLMRDQACEAIVELSPAGAFDVAVPDDAEREVRLWSLDGAAFDGWLWPGTVAPGDGIELTALHEIAPRVTVDRDGDIEVFAFDADNTPAYDAGPHPDGLELLAPPPSDRDDVAAAAVVAGVLRWSSDDFSWRRHRLLVRTGGGPWTRAAYAPFVHVPLVDTPAGDLALVVLGGEGLDRPEIVAVHENGERGLLAAEDGVHTGLHAGRWDLHVRRRPTERDGQRAGGETYARAEVDIVPGEVSVLRLSVDPGAVPALGSIIGRVHVADGWPTEPYSRQADVVVELKGLELGNVDVKRRDAVRLAKSDGGPERVGEFGIERLPEGRYELNVRGLGWTEVVHVPAAVVDVRVPAPADLRVRLVDADDGAELEASSVVYFADRPERDVRTGWQVRFEAAFGRPDELVDGLDARRELAPFEGSAAWTGHAAPGSGRVGALVADDSQLFGTSPYHECALERVEGLRPGEIREVEVRAERRGVAEVTCLVGDIEIPTDGLEVAFTRVGGARHVLRGALRRLQLAPGEWRLEVPPVQGLRVHAPDTVHVAFGEITDVSIRLEPE